MATVVGLPFRQLLFAYSPAQADQDLFFHSLEQELRRSATEFKRSQAELVQLVQEFVEARKGLFHDEEQASRRYVRNLEKTVELFDDTLNKYPELIKSALSHCAQSLLALAEKSAELSRSAQSLTTQPFADLVTQFATVRDRTSEMAEEIVKLQQSLNQINIVASELPESVSNQARIAAVTFDQLHNALRDQLQVIKNDVSAIDGVLTDFAELMQERIVKAVA